MYVHCVNIHLLIDASQNFQNTAKNLWSMHHIMRSDPRRRFAFGITIEDLTMRLWFCDRALVLVSEPINLHQVRVALSLSVSLVLISLSKRIAEAWWPSLLPSSSLHALH